MKPWDDLRSGVLPVEARQLAAAAKDPALPPSITLRLRILIADLCVLADEIEQLEQRGGEDGEP